MTAVTARTWTTTPSPIGPLTLVADGGVLCGVYMVEHRRGPDAAALGERDAAGFEDAEAQLAEYFARRRRAFDLPLRPRGTAFQQRVWRALTRIPYGETRTYAGLAAELGDPLLVRAVGAANALNPLSVVVPCHRVVGADGKLTGFAGGLERKRFLLDLESDGRLF
jgi:methylated-DNA-[protein]-cysteine S-methyltransferase